GSCPEASPCCIRWSGVLGGIISDWLMRRTGSLNIARKTPIVMGMLLSMVMVFCNYVNVEWMIIGFMALAFFGKGIGCAT
ncbi:hypothetical protein AAIH56_36230, partial [Pseudomonas aeruginosa]